MEHLGKVKYLSGYIVARPPDMVGWVFRQDPEGYVDASGPCPTCKGAAYGPALPDIADREVTRGTIGATIDVPCRCHCGFDHGKGSDLGCGRSWIATGRAAQP